MKNCVIDLFCGIGGLTKGLELAGLNVVAGIDIDDSCRFAYEKNNNAHFIKYDINNLSPSCLNSIYPMDSIRILVGCAPCQPFSKYSKRYRKTGRKDDKWKLINTFSSLIEHTLPHIVSMENVPELVHEEVFDTFLKILEENNYFTEWKIVYCPDYGIPQKRKRLVLTASSLGSIHLIHPTHSQDQYRTVKDAIGSMPPLKNGQVDVADPMHRTSRLSPLNLLRIRQSLQGGTWRDWDQQLQLKCHKKASGKSYPSVYGRMSWDEPSPTITTQFYGYGNGRFGHPQQDRAISLREGAILQSFPPDYVFIDSEQL